MENRKLNSVKQIDNLKQGKVLLPFVTGYGGIFDMFSTKGYEDLLQSEENELNEIWQDVGNIMTTAMQHYRE